MKHKSRHLEKDICTVKFKFEGLGYFKLYEKKIIHKAKFQSQCLTVVPRYVHFNLCDFLRGNGFDIWWDPKDDNKTHIDPWKYGMRAHWYFNTNVNKVITDYATRKKKSSAQ
jgi:hypothetical protein